MYIHILISGLYFDDKNTVYTYTIYILHVIFFASNILIRKARKVACEIFSSRNLQKLSNLAGLLTHRSLRLALEKNTRKIMRIFSVCENSKINYFIFLDKATFPFDVFLYIYIYYVYDVSMYICISMLQREHIYQLSTIYLRQG